MLGLSYLPKKEVFMKSMILALTISLSFLLTSSSAINSQNADFCPMHTGTEAELCPMHLPSSDGQTAAQEQTIAPVLLREQAVASAQVQAQEEDPPAPPQHGEFGGKKMCYNTGKEKNCDCHRACYNGTPGKDNKCKNYCFEDKCKCRTACNT